MNINIYAMCLLMLVIKNSEETAYVQCLCSFLFIATCFYISHTTSTLASRYYLCLRIMHTNMVLGQFKQVITEWTTTYELSLLRVCLVETLYCLASLGSTKFVSVLTCISVKYLIFQFRLKYCFACDV